MDSKIRMFSASIENFIDGSELPSEVKRLVLAELLQKETAKANEHINQQIDRQQKRKGGGKKDAKSV